MALLDLDLGRNGLFPFTSIISPSTASSTSLMPVFDEDFLGPVACGRILSRFDVCLMRRKSNYETEFLSSAPFDVDSLDFASFFLFFARLDLPFSLISGMEGIAQQLSVFGR